MELKDISIERGVDEDTVQFIKHLEENLDPDDDFNCEVWIETVDKNDVEKASMEPTKAVVPLSQTGVHLHSEYPGDSNPIEQRLQELTKSFYAEDNIKAVSFRAGEGESHTYIFKL